MGRRSVVREMDYSVGYHAWQDKGATFNLGL